MDTDTVGIEDDLLPSRPIHQNNNEDSSDTTDEEEDNESSDNSDSEADIDVETVSDEDQEKKDSFYKRAKEKKMMEILARRAAKLNLDYAQ